MEVVISCLSENETVVKEAPVSQNLKLPLSSRLIHMHIAQHIDDLTIQNLQVTRVSLIKRGYFGGLCKVHKEAVFGAGVGETSGW